MSFERNRPPAQFTNNIRQFQEQQNPHLKLCFTFFKWIPVLFISAAFVWSYYAYVVQLCFSKCLCVPVHSDAMPVLCQAICFYAQNRLLATPILTLSFFPVTVETVTERVILIALFHVFFTMFLWAYFQTIFTQIGVVPKKVSPPG